MEIIHKKYHMQSKFTSPPLSGFTLLELIVTVAAIALMSIVLSQIFFTTLRTNTKTEILKEVKQNGDLAQETLARMIQSAQAINSTCDATGVESTSIDIINPDGGLTTLACADDGLVARIASVSAGATDYLTSSNVTLGGTCSTGTLTFVCKGGVGIPSYVKISFTLSQVGTPPSQFDTSSVSFQTSVTTRNVMR